MLLVLILESEASCLKVTLSVLQIPLSLKSGPTKSNLSKSNLTAQMSLVHCSMVKMQALEVVKPTQKI